MLKNKLFQICLMGMIVLSFPSCNGVLEGIYDNDEASESTFYGFYNTNPGMHSGTVCMDARSYVQWVYVNLDSMSFRVERIPQGKATDVKPVGGGWTFALHRYDVKTNGGGVMETSYTSLGDLLTAGKIPEGEFTEDVQDSVTIDMSGMAEGHIKKAPSTVNPVAAKWLDVDTTDMPPNYTLSKKVYLLRTKEGKYAALYFSDFRSRIMEKGAITIDYIYPLEF